MPKRKYHRNRRPGARSPGRPATGKNTMIGIRWEKPLLAGIDRFARDQMLDRCEALRQIVKRFLVDKKMIDPSKLYPATEAAE
jgi:hypothetical protein